MIARPTCEDCGAACSGRRGRSLCSSCAAKRRHKDRPCVAVNVDERFREQVEKTRWYSYGSGYQYGNPFPGQRSVYLHRYVWFLAYGHWPKMLDHINRDRADNRLENLRLASHRLNGMNRTPKSRASGLPVGVEYKAGRTKPYFASVRRHRRNHSLGYYATVEEAAEVARNAREIIEEFEIAQSEDLARAG